MCPLFGERTNRELRRLRDRLEILTWADRTGCRANLSYIRAGFTGLAAGVAAPY